MHQVQRLEPCCMTTALAIKQGGAKSYTSNKKYAAQSTQISDILGRIIVSIQGCDEDSTMQDVLPFKDAVFYIYGGALWLLISNFFE